MAVVILRKKLHMWKCASGLSKILLRAQKTLGLMLRGIMDNCRLVRTEGRAAASTLTIGCVVNIISRQCRPEFTSQLRLRLRAGGLGQRHRA